MTGPRWDRPEPTALRRLAVTWTLMVFAVAIGWTMVGVFDGTSWQAWFALPALGMLAFLALLRLVRSPEWAGPVLGILALVAMMSVCFGDGTAIWGFIPTTETFERWRELSDLAIDYIAEASSPAEPSEGLMLFTAAAGALVGWGLDITAVGLAVPAWTGLIGAAALAVPMAFTIGGVPKPALAGIVAGYLLVLWVATPRARPSRDPEPGAPRGRDLAAWGRGAGIVLAAATAAAGGIVLAPEYYSSSPLVDGLPKVLVFGNGVSPLVDLGQDLGARVEKQALKVTASALWAPPYLRVMALEDFSDNTWKHRETEVEPLGEGMWVDRSSTAPLGWSTEVRDQRIEILDLRSDWLPVPMRTELVSGLTGSWGTQPGDGTVTAIDATASGQAYLVEWERPAMQQVGGTEGAYWDVVRIEADGLDGTSDIIADTRESRTFLDSGASELDGLPLASASQEMADPGLLPPGVRADLEVPADLPPVIAETAQRVTEARTGPIDKAMGLLAYFRQTDFEYSTEAPDAEGYDSDSSGAIAQFLEVRKGYCVHFAAAMTVMARTLGIPARVAIGFLPGELTGTAGRDRNVYSVTSRQLHAWPELYFGEIGWTWFEPTVGNPLVPTDAGA
ncbi:MAG: DUF3488 and transglutaminase-like domain-containing protein, partial [Bifidobacteriaceae bacterium]|nr:DUF3488 and transglutaminase-like domain-containing protein [Bifidobacteriaceae bacterium]